MRWSLDWTESNIDFGVGNAGPVITDTTGKDVAPAPAPGAGASPIRRQEIPV